MEGLHKHCELCWVAQGEIPDLQKAESEGGTSHGHFPAHGHPLPPPGIPATPARDDTRLSQQHCPVAAPGLWGLILCWFCQRGWHPQAPQDALVGQGAEWQQGHGDGGQGSLPFHLAKLIIMANMPQICLLRSPHCSFNQKLLSNYILLFLCLCVNHFPRELVFNCCLICIIMHINLHT